MNPRKNRIATLLMTGAAALLAAAAAVAAAPAAPAAAPAVDQNGPTILQTYKGHFLIGTSADAPGGFSDQELKLIKENFNVITPENYMKPGPVHPLEDVWSFKRPDALVAWCAENGIAVHAHCLIWHSQTGGWFFQGATRDILIQRMKDHITTLVGRYKGKIHSWDVVNEAINDGGGGGGGRGGAGGANAGEPAENLRGSQWLNIIGPDFLTMAFKFAHDADPDAKLFYNDYNIESGDKHTSSMALLRRLIKDGAPIYGVGIQGHWSTSGLSYAALDKSISDYASLGLKVSISELDITIAGATGGQLNNNGNGGGNGGGRRGGAGAGGTPPATAPGGAFLMNDDQLFFTAAPAGGGGGAGGGGRGGRGAGRGPGGGQAALVNPVTTVESTITDLSDDQKTKLTALSADIATKLAEFQKASQAAMLSVQPQYTPGQVAYQHEVEEQAAEQVNQNALRDGVLNNAEARVTALLTPAQAATWAAARLNAQLSTQFGVANVTDDQKARVQPLVKESAKQLAAATDQAGVTAAKTEFTQKVLGVLDEGQVAQYRATTQPARAAAGRGRGGGGGNAPSAVGLKAQADAYARVFAIFEKHRDTMDRVTIWGLNDARSWRAPQSAVVLDANNLRKPAYIAIVEQLLHPDPALAAPQ